MPILSCAVFSIIKNKLTIKTSDLEQTIVSESKISDERNGSVALPLNKLLEIVSALPDEKVRFSVNEDYLVEINNNQGTYKITGRSSDEFPETPAVNQKEEVVLMGKEILNIIKKTSHAVSRDDLKPALCGVYLNLEKNNITTVATDGHKLVKFTKKTNTNIANKTSLIIPLKFLNILKDNIEENKKVKLSVGENHLLTQQNDRVIISRIIKENFPDFNSVIPNDNTIKVEIEVEKIISSIKRVSIFSNKTTKQIVLTFNSNGVAVSAQDPETSTSAKEHAECVYSGEEITASYNAKYLIEVLQNIGFKKANIYLKSSLTAAVFEPQKNKEEEELVALLMPMRLNQ